MLSHMETDVAVEVVSSIRGNIFRHTEQHKKTPEIEADIKTILAFKRKALRNFKDMDFDEILEFSSFWFAKYPN